MQTSIIIVNYNTFDLTSKCIKSIYKHENQNNYEIILVDNASTECEAIKFKNIFPDITLIESNTNLGFAGGNNLGIKQAKGKYILLLNSDTQLINNAVTIAKDILDHNLNIGVLSGQLQYPSGKFQAASGKFPSLKREFRELFRINKFLKGIERKQYHLGTKWDYTKPTTADWVWGTFFMFRKDDLKQFPGNKLQDDFFMYGEDVQWCYHFKNVLKKEVYYTPEPKVIHYIGGSETNKQEPFTRYIQKMLPNEFKWLCKVKGKVYTHFYYLLKSIVYFTLRNKEDFKKGKFFFKVALKGIKK